MKKHITALILALGVSVSSMANGQGNPLNYPIKEWLFILAMAMLGGAASWYSKVKKGELMATNLFALMGEFVISALSGLVAFLVCDYLTLPLGIAGAAAGLAGHAGARALAVGEVVAQRWVQKRFNVEPTKPTPLDESDRK